MNILRVWEATFTRRWHRHAQLADTHDPISAHQGRVAILAVTLFPEELAVHTAAILHDMGEAIVCDVPNPVKVRNPALKAELDRIEALEMAQMGLPDIALDARQQDMLRLCDKLDAILWARHHRPDLMAHPGWQKDINEVRRLFSVLGIYGRLEGLPL